MITRPHDSHTPKRVTPKHNLRQPQWRGTLSRRGAAGAVLSGRGDAQVRTLRNAGTVTPRCPSLLRPPNAMVQWTPGISVVLCSRALMMPWLVATLQRRLPAIAAAHTLCNPNVPHCRRLSRPAFRMDVFFCRSPGTGLLLFVGLLAAWLRPAVHISACISATPARAASLMIGRVAASVWPSMHQKHRLWALVQSPYSPRPLLRMPSVAPPALSDTSAPLPAHDPRARPPRMSLLRAHSSRLRAATLCLASQSTCHMSARARRPQAGDERRRRTLCRPCRQTARAATRSRSCPRSTKMSSCQRYGADDATI